MAFRVINALVVLVLVVFICSLLFNTFAEQEVKAMIDARALVSFGAWAYVTRSLVLGTLQEDFIMVARAKGVPERRVLYGHTLRAAAPPILTNTLLALIGSMGGAVITESVFNWPGLGRLYWIAIEEFDVPVLLGLTTVFTMLYLAAFVLQDLIYGLLDPRVRIGAERR
ncbi:MAG: ABC transporter permease [Candidatus Methanodesulfokora washburnensis]